MKAETCIVSQYRLGNRLLTWDLRSRDHKRDLFTYVPVVMHRFDPLGRVFTPDWDRKIRVLFQISAAESKCVRLQRLQRVAVWELLAVLRPRSLISWSTYCRQRESRVWLCSPSHDISAVLGESRCLSTQCPGCRDIVSSKSHDQRHMYGILCRARRTWCRHWCLRPTLRQ